MAGIVATAVVGSVTPDNVQTYIGIDYSPYEQSQIILEEPMGSFGIEYDISKHVRLFGEHISTPRTCEDNPGINHAGIKLLAPIDDLTFYSGLSINHTGFDKGDNFNGPLGSIGVEYGDDIKVFAEYLAAFENFDEGRFSIGAKVYFK